MTEEQSRRIEAELAVLKQTAHQLLQDIERLGNEMRASVEPAFSQNGHPRAAARPPSKRALGVPEFARIPDHAWISRAPDTLLIVAFLLVITLPFVAYLLHWQSGLSLAENRELAKPPAFGQDPTAELPAKIDAYYNDYFGFRKQLIHWHSIIQRKWLGISTDNVIIGKDRWLFVADGGIVVQDFLGLSPFTPEQLRSWKEYLETRREVLARRGVRYLFVVPPDKWFIYPEKLPDYIRAKAGRPRLDQLLAFLKATHSPVEILDLRDALLSAKAQGDVFFQQDSHWNGLGYSIACQEICKRLQKWFPEIHPPSPGKDYEIRTVAWPGGEWYSLGLPDENLTYVSTLAFAKGTQTAREVPVKLPPGIIPKLPSYYMPVEMVQPGATHRLLLLHDSYMRSGFAGGTYFPFSDDFADSLYIGMFHVSLPALMDVVKYQHPDVVVEEMVQRRVNGTPERQVTGDPRPPGISQSLKPSDRRSASVLDLINNVSGPAGVPSLHLPGDKEIVIQGWAVDEPDKTVAGGVDLVIDQVIYSANYGLERPDVAAFFKTQAVRRCGFRLVLPPETLSKGPHVATVRTISSDMKSYYPGQTIKFTVD